MLLALCPPLSEPPVEVRTLSSQLFESLARHLIGQGE